MNEKMLIVLTEREALEVAEGNTVAAMGALLACPDDSSAADEAFALLGEALLVLAARLEAIDD